MCLLLNISPDKEIRAERRSRASPIDSTVGRGEERKIFIRMKGKKEMMAEEITLKTSKAKRGFGRQCN
jgi:hypothetical protein